MTQDATQQELWTDDIMHQRYVDAFGTNPDVHHWALLCWMRDEYEARLRSVEQRLERVLDRCLEHSARVEQLEAALADLPQGEGVFRRTPQEDTDGK